MASEQKYRSVCSKCGWRGLLLAFDTCPECEKKTEPDDDYDNIEEDTDYPKA